MCEHGLTMDLGAAQAIGMTLPSGCRIASKMVESWHG
jgi:hypothetical protein